MPCHLPWAAAAAVASRTGAAFKEVDPGKIAGVSTIG